MAHVLPFPLMALVLTAIDLRLAVLLPPAVAYAWIVSGLYAARGAGVLRAERSGAAQSEGRALGLLGDLLDHPRRELYARTGLVLERCAFGTWLVGQAGAVLVRPGGRRVRCVCVRVPAEGLPRHDRVAHLLLALRSDEIGFATVANLAFSGATWRLRRRLSPQLRAALRVAVAAPRSELRPPYS